MTGMVFVTGATGNVGRPIISTLRQRGVPFRIGARTADASAESNGERVLFDFLDPRTFESAISGCTSVFLLRPPAIANTKATLNVFIDVARGAGVTQIVFLSVAGAATNRLIPHHAVERHLQGGPPRMDNSTVGFLRAEP